VAETSAPSALRYFVKPARAAMRPVVAALIGLALGVALTGLAGESPLYVLQVIVVGAFGSAYDVGLTLVYTTPLLLTGLAVAVPFHAGLFNIGGEGQLTLGALAVALTGVLLPGLGPVVAIPLACLAAFLGGALWGLIPGWIKAYRGGHEVIATIMLNFVAAGVASYVVLYVIPTTTTQNPESAEVGAGYLLSPAAVFDGAPVTVALPLALAACVLTWAFLRFRVKGFEIKTVGANPAAAHVAGIDVPRTQLLVMGLAGGLAGLVGVAEIMGSAGRFRLGFSPDYGFIGIPVALLARSHPIGLVFGALLFGALQKGTADLDLETEFVTRDLAQIIQAMVVLAVAAEGLVGLVERYRKKGVRRGPE
jgi:simple sugar transport system permease protein